MGTEEWDAVEDSTLNGIGRDHGVEGEGAGTEVVDEAKFVGMWLRDNVDGHGVHARKKVSAEGGGVPTERDLFISLVS